jgi:hypothetical protein
VLCAGGTFEVVPLSVVFGSEPSGSYLLSVVCCSDLGVAKRQDVSEKAIIRAKQSNKIFRGYIENPPFLNFLWWICGV